MSNDPTEAPEKRTFLQTVAYYAKIVWEVPAVKSVALTWLIRLGVPGAAIFISVADALSK